MKPDNPYAAEGISCFEDVPEYHDPVGPSFAPELRAGQLLDRRFAVVEALSRSGMATIYKARDLERENQIVTVKVPPLRLEADPGFFSRFQREEEIVLHAMQRDPAERFQTAATFKTELDAPSRVRLTGYCDRLMAPHWRLSFRETPVIAGTLPGVGFISLQVLAFLALRHFLAK